MGGKRWIVPELVSELIVGDHREMFNTLGFCEVTSLRPRSPSVKISLLRGSCGIASKAVIKRNSASVFFERHHPGAKEIRQGK
jgi:hypothetical protein